MSTTFTVFCSYPVSFFFLISFMWKLRLNKSPKVMCDNYRVHSLDHCIILSPMYSYTLLMGAPEGVYGHSL